MEFKDYSELDGILNEIYLSVMIVSIRETENGFKVATFLVTEMVNEK